MKTAIGKSGIASPRMFLAVTACVATAGLLTACGGKTSSSSPDKNPGNEQTTPVTTTASAGPSKPLAIPTAAAIAARGKQKLTLYSIITQAQFLNNADDRQRAIINNPFTTDTKKLMEVMKGREKDTGPLPGDTALYSYTLYANSALKKKIGTAVYTCDYAFFGKATCTAYFELEDGVLMASGRTRYKATTYNLSVRGGTYGYLGSRGELLDVPDASAKNARRLSFNLFGS